MDKKEYKINIDPRILELLGPSLYTNIYYILAELIANAYDANASNVYIIQKKNRIIVEDDGFGMSYENGDIEKYLNVAKETRINDTDDLVEGTNRRKMGRKGVGKLAALSVSENVLIMTRKDDDQSGFILSRKVDDDHILKPLEDSEIQFEKIGLSNGTSVVMTDPQYSLHKTLKAIKNNLLKIFPLVSSNFIIHIIIEHDTDEGIKEESLVIDNFDKEIIKELGSLITFGEDYSGLSSFFHTTLEKNDQIISELLKNKPLVGLPITMKNKYGEEKNYILEIEGWIGTYRTTKGRKMDRNDFPDNFISILSNGKMGEYNILPTVGKNVLSEVYVVGQLHVNLLEKTELPDIALSNRQGYKTDDVRYKTLVSHVSDKLLPEIIAMRGKFAGYKKDEEEKGRLEKERKNEENLKQKTEEYKKTTSTNASKRIQESIASGNIPGFEEIQNIVGSEMNVNSGILGIKESLRNA